MKTIVTLLIALLITTVTFAQQGINYKAIIKDGSGNLVASQAINVRFTIQKSNGTGIYSETHSPTTDVNGIIIANIGEGSTADDFSTIDWSNSYQLQTEVDLTGTYVIVGSPVPFKAVPHALQSKRADIATVAENVTFETTNNVTNNSPGNLTLDDFVFGSTQLDNDESDPVDNSRMFFDKGKSSFRAGRTLGDEWDDANVGNRSAAFGLNTIASGTYSLATGNRTKAESLASTAIGAYNVGGGNPTGWVGTDPLFEIGNGTATISTETRNNALTVLKNGNVGIGYNSETPTQVLDVSGKIKVNNDSTTPTPGTIRFNESSNAFEGFIETTGWVTLGEKIGDKTIVIPASHFIGVIGPFNSSVPKRIRYDGNTVFIDGIFTYAPSIFVQAPIILPINSVLKSITYVFEDLTINRDLNFTLTKHCGDTTSETVTVINVHSVSSLNSTNLFKYTYSLNETIGASCQYNITASSTDGWGNGELKVHKVYLTYEED